MWLWLGVLLVVVLLLVILLWQGGALGGDASLPTSAATPPQAVGSGPATPSDPNALAPPSIDQPWNAVVQWLENLNPQLAAQNPAPVSETGSWADAQ